MKLVTFNRAMAPYNAGEARLVPDDVAAQLAQDGVLSSTCEWPEGGSTAAPPAAAPSAKPKLSLKPRPQTYLTKDRETLV